MGDPDWKYDNKYWERLVGVYKEQLRGNPKSYAYVPLADALTYLGRIEEAIEVLTWGLTNLPDSRAAKVMLAQLLYDIGDVAGAKLLLEDVTGRWPDVTEAVSLLCRIYETEGDGESAMIKSAALLDYYPDSDPIRKLADYYKSKIARAGVDALAHNPAKGEAARPEGKEGKIMETLERMLAGIKAVKSEKEGADG
jgi:hypothetical protein